MIEKSILLVFVAAVIGAGVMAGVVGFSAGSQDGWSPRAYVAADGECFVPPQGDPLYDEHYAKNVNNPNCDAFKVQSEAGYLDAQTEQVRVDTGINLFGVYAILGILVVLLVLFLVAK